METNPELYEHLSSSLGTRLREWAGPWAGSGSAGQRLRVPLWLWRSLRSGEPVLDAKSKVTCQLIDFQWKLGMAVSSDTCRSLKYPYVAVVLKVADHSGQVNSKSIEMTIPQFQNFYRQFKEIAAVMETV
ncbi:COMM domain-containing protein 6 isoform X1 [Onychomys torridus]|uniref:COMM domain-containing protein 6 isoform X1 n=2 Tax=Onychomys torridus TaxID=38674 RepID=UPI00167F51AF|nr:COMM domain-containing protein 6 isoform X1 [Onychomys torridus]